MKDGKGQRGWGGRMGLGTSGIVEGDGRVRGDIGYALSLLTEGSH